MRLPLRALALNKTRLVFTRLNLVRRNFTVVLSATVREENLRDLYLYCALAAFERNTIKP